MRSYTCDDLNCEGSMNRVDEYYQQQEEMLEGFTKMDDLTEDDTLEYGSKVRFDDELSFLFQY